MSNKKLAILGIVALVMFIWAIVQSKISNTVQEVTTGTKYLVSGVNIDDISSIFVKSDGKTLTLKRQSGRFVVADKDNYPAETSKVNDLISKCLEIEVSSEIVTDNSANHKDLGVTEDFAQVIVKFLNLDSEEIVGIIVGDSKEKGNGAYLRLASQDKVYETEETPFIEVDPIQYIKTQLVALTLPDTEMVTVISPEERYTLKSVPDSEDIELEDKPIGKQLKPSEAKAVFTALSSLNFTDVMIKPSDLNFDKQFKCRLYNSTEFTFDIGTKDGLTYVSCRAIFTEGRPESIRIDETEEELKVKEEKFLLDDKADAFSARHIGWVYEIPAYSAKYLTLPLSDLLEESEEINSGQENPDPNAILEALQDEAMP